MYLGEWQIDDVLTFSITTHTAATGALTDADSAPAYRVYEDETGTALLTGSMALLDDANTTGHYSEQITLSAANGFEEGKTYTIYIAATVATVTGGTTRTFQVEAAKATAAAVADIPTVAEFEARTIAAANYATASALDAVDNFLDTEIAAILEDTGTTIPATLANLALESTAQSILTDTAEIGVAGAGLTAADDAVIAAIAALNNLSSAGAQAAAAAALLAYDAATGTDVTNATSGLSTFDATTDAVTVGTIQADAITAAAIAAAAAQEIADAVLSRGVSNVEATADAHSLTAIVLAALESAIVGTDWTIYRTDGTTPFTTKTVTVDANADPITAVE